jgi:hypothetical protein|tara:strand:- start:13 stop:294 length:282 start_codon:yes stop_codon:yes gene_type:complete
MVNMEIERTLVASTIHTEVDDIDLLHMDEQWRMNQYEHGIMIYIGDEEAIQTFSSNFSEGLKLLVLFAVSLNCKYLKLDADGPIYEEFPEYDW